VLGLACGVSAILFLLLLSGVFAPSLDTGSVGAVTSRPEKKLTRCS
jgi:hypothetical protein